VAQGTRAARPARPARSGAALEGGLWNSGSWKAPASRDTAGEGASAGRLVVGAAAVQAEEVEGGVARHLGAKVWLSRVSTRIRIVSPGSSAWAGTRSTWCVCVCVGGGGGKRGE
jgi:hypothetical protein